MTDPRALPAPIKPCSQTGTATMSSPGAVRRAAGALSLDSTAHRWKLIAFIFASVTAALIISARLTRFMNPRHGRYRPPDAVGHHRAGCGARSVERRRQFLATQVKLIQSDSVLRPVAQQYHLLDLERDASDVTPEKPSRRKTMPHSAQETEVTRRRIRIYC